MAQKIFRFILSKLLGRGMYSIYNSYVVNMNKKNYKSCGKDVHLYPPLFLWTKSVSLEDYTRLQGGIRVICNTSQSVIIKKYASIGAETTIIPGNHTPTVGVPQYLSYLGINDVNNTLIIGEDAWIGAKSMLLSKAQIGRGAIIAGGTTVTKEVLPYSIVGGSPAKTIAVRFSITQIIEHEKQLYPSSDRFSREFLTDLFSNHYEGLKIIGVSTISAEEMTKLETEKNRLQFGIF